MDDLSEGKVMIITVQHYFTKNTFDTFRLFKKEIEKNRQAFYYYRHKKKSIERDFNILLLLFLYQSSF